MIVVLTIWCIPYLTSGNRIELGDFGMFVQRYEAIRRSILDYHQFPWMNPWVSGGVPLYADPQVGVFSLQTLLVLAFGSPMGLKLAVVVYTCLGFASMYMLLRCYIGLDVRTSGVLGLLWVLCTFFVAHLPAHFTFVWYMLAPFFIHLSLVVKKLKGGLWLGLSFAVMALAAVHNAFIHIAAICSLILVIRMVVSSDRLGIVKACCVTCVTFIAVAGHRILLTEQYVSEIHRKVLDPAPTVADSFLALWLPFSSAHPNWSIEVNDTPYGWAEHTATLGILFNIVCLACVAVLATRVLRGERSRQLVLMPAASLLIACMFVLIGLGSTGRGAPYGLIKKLPVFEEMRVSSRWYIWACLMAIVFVASISRSSNERMRRIAVWLLAGAIAQNLILNGGYQYRVMDHDVAISTVSAKTTPFTQVRLFGNPPALYNEYEATLSNEGVIDANDALVPIRADNGLCTSNARCGLVLTDNARVLSWSPNKLLFERSAPGPISLSLNESNYYLVNGERRHDRDVVDAGHPMVIESPDRLITVRASPDVTW